MHDMKFYSDVIPQGHMGLGTIDQRQVNFTSYKLEEALEKRLCPPEEGTDPHSCPQCNM